MRALVLLLTLVVVWCGVSSGDDENIAFEPGEIFVVLKSDDLAKRVSISKDATGIVVTGLSTLDRLFQCYEVRQAFDLKGSVSAPELLSPKDRRTVILPVETYNERVRALIDRLNALDEVEVADYIPYASTALTPDDPNSVSTNLTDSSWGALKERHLKLRTKP